MMIHSFPIRVYYEDTDAGSVVYHASYLRFAERARTEMLRDIGYVHTELLKQTGIAFAVRHLEIDYQRAAQLDDELDILTHVSRIGRASFDMMQVIKRGEAVIAELKVVLVCMDVKKLAAVRLPQDIRSLLEAQEGELANV